VKNEIAPNGPLLMEVSRPLLLLLGICFMPLYLCGFPAPPAVLRIHLPNENYHRYWLGQ